MQRAVFGIMACLALALLWPGAGARATQTDPELDVLFARLQQTLGREEAEVIQAQIWLRWIATEDRNAERMMAVGTRAMEQNRLDDALSTFDALVEAAPDFAEAWNKRATVEYMQGDYSASVADIERTLTLEPRHFGALSGLGLIYSELGDLAAAIRAFEAAVKVNPYLPQVRENIDKLKKQLKDKGT